ncbi:8-oxo-dGTP diphosphatase MutT [Algisphaera agarilytica]|uniref:8-oxo-dGTP diphosphatase n=1 Tax=Algisphaera agarilytica TaxID=1385975 RepID=A0A7X0LL73_9BACT|nr:8-oxo-dGTP diphosphatase MutT [Algisphaera agarilytica]MBB6430712.1 mutator protein MutT [Algisphaera agarilytica]
MNQKSTPLSVDVAIGITCRRHPETRAYQVLISRRAKNGVLGGLWEFPGGKLEAGESAQQCAVRELREELGIEVKPTTPLSPIAHQYEHAHVTLHPFYCELISGEPTAIEVDDWAWVEVKELDEYPFPPANAALLEQVQVDLRG